MKTLNHSFQKSKVFENWFKPLSRNRDPNMTQIEHVYAICCLPEVAGGDVICGENVKTNEGYAVLNLVVVSLISFRDIQKYYFRT